jgi:hypothetical protein
LSSGQDDELNITEPYLIKRSTLKRINTRDNFKSPARHRFVPGGGG